MCFTDVFYQVFKEESTPVHTDFSKVKERILPHTFYEASMTLISKQTENKSH